MAALVETVMLVQDLWTWKWGAPEFVRWNGARCMKRNLWIGTESFKKEMKI